MKTEYSKKEWLQREEYYYKNISSIVIPHQTTKQDLQEISARINAVLTEAHFDKAFIYKKIDSAKSTISRSEQQAWLHIDTHSFEIENGKKPIKEEKEGLVSLFLQNQKYDGTDVGLYTYYDEMKSRGRFIDSVIAALSDKMSTVLNHISTLSMEAKMFNN